MTKEYAIAVLVLIVVVLSVLLGVSPVARAYASQHAPWLVLAGCGLGVGLMLAVDAKGPGVFGGAAGKRRGGTEHEALDEWADEPYPEGAFQAEAYDTPVNLGAYVVDTDTE